MKANLNGMAGALAVAVGCMGGVSPASAQSSDPELRQKMDQLQQQIDMLRAQLDKVSKQSAAAATPAGTTGAAPVAAAGHEFIERKPGNGVTFVTRGGELSIYGNLDISVDDATKGIGGMTAANAPTSPVGRTGWLPDISTNLSYIGVRGFQSHGSFPAHFVYQLETSICVSS